MRSSDNGVCSACGERSRPWSSKNGYELDECRGCGTIVTVLPESALGTAEHYAEYHSSSQFLTPEPVEASLARLVRSAAPYRLDGNWLDLGFGEGSLLAIAEEQGWTCFGSEVSPHALAHAEKRGWTVAADPATDPRFVRAMFDVVSLLEVLEHVPSPRDYLRDAVGWLRPGGLLYLTTPNARSLNRRMLGSNWSIFCPPEHLTLLTATALRRILATLGVEAVQVRAEGFNPAELRARMARRHPDEVNRQAEGLALSRALSKSAPRRAFKRAANALLNLTGAGDTLKLRARKRQVS